MEWVASVAPIDQYWPHVGPIVGAIQINGERWTLAKLYIVCLSKKKSYWSIVTLNRGFSFFCTAELKDTLNWFKSAVVLSGFLNTTAITNFSGPPVGGGTPMAAVSRTWSSASLQILSISTELTCSNKWTIQTN